MYIVQKGYFFKRGSKIEPLIAGSTMYKKRKLYTHEINKTELIKTHVGSSCRYTRLASSRG